MRPPLDTSLFDVCALMFSSLRLRLGVSRSEINLILLILYRTYFSPPPRNYRCCGIYTSQHDLCMSVKIVYFGHSMIE